jgi:uncharacterized protein (TIGR02147 family)
MTDRKFYLNKLNSELEKRKRKNPYYSTRSYARDLVLDSSSLCSILKGNRKIPLSKIEQLANVICETDSEKKQFIDSAKHTHTSLNKIKKHHSHFNRTLVSEEEFAQISDINTYTFLSLLELDGFKYDIEWMAKRLNLSQKLIQSKINTLLDLGMIQEIDGTIERTKKRTTTSDEIASKYIKKHHMDSLDLAKKKCAELGPLERYFSTITIPADPIQLEKLKTLFMEFEDKITEFLNTQQKKEVFKLSIQFYPATEKDS